MANNRTGNMGACLSNMPQYNSFYTWGYKGWSYEGSANSRAYHSHVTRILNKVEDTLAKEIDELALTYLKTSVTQLEKKHEQIYKADTQIAELIQEPGELEEAILG